MNPRHAYAVALRYWYLVLSNPQRIVQIFIWGALDIILWGFLTRYLDSIGGAKVSIAAILLGAVILWSFLTRAMQGVSTPALEDTWSRNLLNYFASPLTVGEYILGLVSSSVFTTLIGFALILFFALLFFGFSIFVLGLYLVPFLFALFIFGVALGIFAIAIITRYGPSAEWFVWPIPTVIQPFCGVFYPVAILPAWMQAVSHVLAPAYVFEGMRAVVVNGTFPVRSLLVAMSLSILTLILSYLFYKRVHRAAIRSGGIARASAESVY